MLLVASFKGISQVISRWPHSCSSDTYQNSLPNMQRKYQCHRSCSCTIASCGISGLVVRKSQKLLYKVDFQHLKMTWQKNPVQFPFAGLWHSWNYKPPIHLQPDIWGLYPRYLDPSGQRYSWRWSFIIENADIPIIRLVSDPKHSVQGIFLVSSPAFIEIY